MSGEANDDIDPVVHTVVEGSEGGVMFVMIMDVVIVRMIVVILSKENRIWGGSEWMLFMSPNVMLMLMIRTTSCCFTNQTTILYH